MEMPAWLKVLARSATVVCTTARTGLVRPVAFQTPWRRRTGVWHMGETTVPRGAFLRGHLALASSAGGHAEATRRLRSWPKPAALGIRCTSLRSFIGPRWRGQCELLVDHRAPHRSRRLHGSGTVDVGLRSIASQPAWANRKWRFGLGGFAEQRRGLSKKEAISVQGGPDCVFLHLHRHGIDGRDMDTVCRNPSAFSRS